MSQSLLEPIPRPARLQVVQLAAAIIEQAASFGEDYWGLTPYQDAIRVNVGWTEILTAQHDSIRLIVDGKLAQEAGPFEGLSITEGEDSRGFYPSVPGSVCAEVQYFPLELFERVIYSLQPALVESVRLAARRRTGRGVKAGHNQAAVNELAALLGRALPTPGYAGAFQNHPDSPDLMEGALRRVMSSVHERNRDARDACIEHYGATCFVCSFSFEAAYGELGRGFIHVHHLTPVSSIGSEYRVDPITDLRPVCPNCHAMLHRDDPPLTVEELQTLMHKEAAV